ncbi:hypothetical protein LTR84_003465 [Exophiala bonariae]|uniref:Uncharacterized protein n=1 Tax=Exophiala bonariae TaxID=1690606 RepID=A0AAV9N9T9_9EURO|nr:hypothetical protein LTR84_003465 [Exophiala bonariae]
MSDDMSVWKWLAFTLTAVAGMAAIGIASIAVLNYVEGPRIERKALYVPQEPSAPLDLWQDSRPSRAQLAGYSVEELVSLAIDISRVWSQNLEGLRNEAMKA